VVASQGRVTKAKTNATVPAASAQPPSCRSGKIRGKNEARTRPEERVMATFVVTGIGDMLTDTGNLSDVRFGDTKTGNCLQTRHFMRKTLRHTLCVG